MVQLVGEGRVSLDMLEKGYHSRTANPGHYTNHERRGNVRTFYAEAIDLANQALIRNGYKPIPIRKNYFPHFSETEGCKGS
jgi:hypothetical protein